MTVSISIGVEQLVAEANAQIETITIDQANGLLGDVDVQFVDIRDVRELQREGIVPGAYHAPRGMLEFWVDPKSPYHKEIFASGKRFVLFCGGGWRSALAAQQLQRMGLKPICHIEGGFKAWKEAGYPVAEKPASNPK